MTAKQKANRARFKKAIAEAKKLRKKNPKLTQAQAVKQAWAILYSTGKIGYSEKRKQLNKKATVEIKKLKKKFPDRYMNKNSDIVRDGYAQAALNGTRKSKSTKVKAKKSKRTSEMHTDTKSHNVNIRVVSGIANENLKQINFINQHIEKWRRMLYFLEDRLHFAKTMKEKQDIRKDIKEAKYHLKTLEHTLKEFKKIKK